MSAIEILAITAIPSLLVLLASLLSQRTLLRENRRLAESNNAVVNRKVTLPIRLQAYERLALLLERISPEHLLLNVNGEGENAKEYEAHLLETVRTEWGHNLSQQIYVSQEVWDLMRHAKGNVSQLIGLCGEKTHPEASASELSKNMLGILIELPSHPTARALEALRLEASRLF